LVKTGTRDEKKPRTSAGLVFTRLRLRNVREGVGHYPAGSEEQDVSGGKSVEGKILGKQPREIYLCEKKELRRYTKKRDVVAGAVSRKVINLRSEGKINIADQRQTRTKGS